MILMEMGSWIWPLLPGITEGRFPYCCSSRWEEIRRQDAHSPSRAFMCCNRYAVTGLARPANFLPRKFSASLSPPTLLRASARRRHCR